MKKASLVFTVTLLLAIIAGACGTPAPKTASPATTPAKTSAPPAAATTAPAKTTTPSTAATATPSAAPKETYWGPYYLYTTVMGSLSYLQNFAIAEVFRKKGSRMKLEAKPSSGMFERLEYIKRNPAEAFKYIPIISPADMKSLWKGAGEYTGYPMPDWRYTTGYQVALNGFVTCNPNIKTLADLAGHSVALGLKSQVAYGTQMEHLLKVAGVADKCKIQWAGTGPAMEGLLDGIFDVAVTKFQPAVVATQSGGRAVDTSVYIYPDAALEQVLGGRKKIYAVDLGFDNVNKLCQEREYGKNAFPGLVPKGTLNIVPNDLYWIALPYGWKVHKDIPEEVIYTFVTDLIKYQKDIETYVRSWEILSPAMYTAGTTWDVLHPGAARAYRELGWSNLVAN